MIRHFLKCVKEREVLYIHHDDLRFLKVGEILAQELNQFSK